MMTSNNYGMDSRIDQDHLSEKLRTAAYIRVSTDKDDQENSYKVQQKYFEDLLSDNHKYINAGVYSDQGISGISAKNRIGLQSLLNDCKSGYVDRIHCKSISRFSRNTLDFIQTLAILKQNNVTILFEKENIDTAIPQNEVMVTIFAALAEKESKNISENINWANVRRYRSGEVPNEVLYGYRWCREYTILESGYKYRSIEIVPEEAAVVKRIFQSVADGMKYSHIAKQLNSDKIIPPKQYGSKRKHTVPHKKWTGRHISNIIMNERYTGCVLTQKSYTSDMPVHKHKVNKGELDQYLVWDHHPAIISMELFKRTQAVRIRNAKCYGNNKTGGRRTQILSGILFCPVCGHKLYTNGRNRTPYWFCPHQCGKRIDEIIVFDLMQKAFYTKFDVNHSFKPNIIRLLKVTETYREQKIMIDNKLIYLQSRNSALKAQTALLVKKLETVTDTKAKQVLQSGIHLLKASLNEESKNCDLLQNEYERLVESEKNYLQYIDLNKALLSMLETEERTDFIVEEIIHKYIRSVIFRITIISPDSISVQWIDNSITIVRR